MYHRDACAHHITTDITPHLDVCVVARACAERNSLGTDATSMAAASLFIFTFGAAASSRTDDVLLWARHTEESIYEHVSYSDGAFLLSNFNGPPATAELMPAAKAAGPLWTWSSPLNNAGISIDGVVVTASNSVARAGLALAYVDLKASAIAVGWPAGNSTSNRTSFSYETKMPYGNVTRLALSAHHHVTCHESPGAPARLLLRNATTGAMDAGDSLPPGIRQCGGASQRLRATGTSMVAAAIAGAKQRKLTRVAIAPKLEPDLYAGDGLVIATQRDDGNGNISMDMEDLSSWVERTADGKFVNALAMDPSGRWTAFADNTGLKLVEPAGGGWSLPNLIWGDNPPPAKAVPQAIGWAADGSVLGVAYAIDPDAGPVGPSWQLSVVVAYAWPPKIDATSGDPIMRELARHELRCYAELLPFPSSIHVTDGGEAVVAGLWGCSNGTGTGRDNPTSQTAVVLPVPGGRGRHASAGKLGGGARGLGTNGTVYAVAAHAVVRWPQHVEARREDEVDVIVALAGKRTHAEVPGRGGFAEAWRLRL